MFKVNDNYLKLPGSYLFSTIAHKVAAYQQAHRQKGKCVFRSTPGQEDHPSGHR